MGQTDDIGYLPRDYENLRDGFVRYMCEQVTKGRRSFSSYELMLGSKMAGYFGNMDALKSGILDDNGIYRVIIEEVMRLLLTEDFLVRTDDQNVFAATNRLLNHCKAVGAS